MASVASRLPFDRTHAAWPVARAALTSRRFILTLAATWLVASGLAGLDLAYRYAALDGTRLPSWFDLAQDGGLGEIYEYMLAIAASAGLVLAARREGSALFAALAVVFAWIGLDNALQLHERAGAAAAPLFGFAPRWGLEPKDIGELLAFVVVGSAVLAGLAVSRTRSDFRERVLAGAIVALIAVVAVFAVGVDLLHAAMRLHSPLVNHAMTFVEEFGEMVSLAAAAAFSLSLPRR